MPNDKDPKPLAEMIESTRELAETSGQTFTAHLLELAKMSLEGDTAELDKKMKEFFTTQAARD